MTAADRELPPRLQRRFAARLDAPWRRELATGHLPMLENPGALAATILSFLEPRG
jgi:pimeloyl-ACP methyl ester carboxylesterase